MELRQVIVVVSPGSLRERLSYLCWSGLCPKIPPVDESWVRAAVYQKYECSSYENRTGTQWLKRELDPVMLVEM